MSTFRSIICYDEAYSHFGIHYAERKQVASIISEVRKWKSTLAKRLRGTAGNFKWCSEVWQSFLHKRRYKRDILFYWWFPKRVSNVAQWWWFCIILYDDKTFAGKWFFFYCYRERLCPSAPFKCQQNCMSYQFSFCWLDGLVQDYLVIPWWCIWLFSTTT